MYTLAISKVHLPRSRRDRAEIAPKCHLGVISQVVADVISPGFDDGMIRLRGLPFLEEEPPHEFELLTARDVMVRPTPTTATKPAASPLVKACIHPSVHRSGAQHRGA